MKAKITLLNIWYYIQGTLRYKLYYSRFDGLMRRYIKDQIGYRIAVMDRQCFENGSCKMCGCRTTALQMANKACDKPCYPVMKSRREWDNLLLQNYIKNELAKKED